LPSDLLRRRPDIREAERELAAATAGVGVQVANLYPKFNVMAFGPAFASTTTNHLFDLNNAASLGYGMIQWPIFEGGARARRHPLGQGSGRSGLSQLSADHPERASEC
jgi:outer membrane protein TolC